MRRNLRLLLAASLVLLFGCLTAGRTLAAAQDRIAGTLNNGQTALLQGNVSPKAQKQYDQGPVESSLQMSYVTLMIKPSASQQTALNQLLAEQQDKSSPNFHKWLTPAQFGEQFGLSENDIGKITAWLQSQGFTIEKPANGRNWIAFSGTAGQVQTTFHTEIHHYLVNGKMHFANATAPSIPLALAGIVNDIRGLNDFHPEAPNRNAGQQSKMHPMSDFTNGNVGPGNEFLAPGDLATIYDITPLYTAGINGTGQKIAIAGQTDINTQDITDYQTLFSLPIITPTIVLYGPDPCGGNINNCNQSDQIESDLDLEVSNAVAQNATIYYATSVNVFMSAMEVIDNNLAPVLSISYGGCEPDNQSSLASLQSLAQQGNAEGITWMASSGDSGAAGCDRGGANQATMGLAVNIPASIPEVTGVGGTEFDEGGNYSQFWSSTNNANGGSALSYIPEIAWNDTAAQGGLDATGGGVSTFYPLPPFQTGVAGIQGNGFRNVPDISLSASNGNDPYFICVQLSCENNGFFAVGGTSASAPAFAGMVVLVNQFLAVQGTQPTPVGNINPTLYSLAQTTPTAFHDITTGNNIVPCQSGSTGCPGSGSYGYSAGPGYDPVTGLGSVDANILVTNWVGVSLAPTTTTLTASPTTINQGASVTLTATVAPASGNVTPTGTVTFLNGATSLGMPVTLSSGVATLMTTALPAGSDSITAVYGGDSTYAGSTSLPVVVTVNAPPGVSFSSSPTNLIVAQGGTATSTITVTSTGGFTGTVNLSCSGAPSEATCSVPTSVMLTANGTATATLMVTTTAPSTVFGYRRVGPGPQTPVLVIVIGLLGLMGLALAHKSLAATGGSSLRWPAMAAVVVLASVGMASCGGGGGSSGNAGTPPGSYAIVIAGTATGITIQPLSVQLSVDAAGNRKAK